MKAVNEMDIILGNVKWNKIFESEAELIERMRGIDINKYKRDCRKSYKYIEGFQKTKELSKGQLTQLKRLAKEIYRYHKGF